ncbi:MAG TPA: response regulator [Thermoanaerobaculia bacterium]|jgi:CheY-like chemotaxis protein
MSNAEKPSALLVDDNEATCTLITALLQRDFVVETASNGLEAIEKLRTNQYVVVLLDLRMPQYDGFSVLDFLKANNPEMLKSVLVVTAMLKTHEIERANSYGICGIITKPFDVDVLLGEVKKCVGDMDRGTLGNVFCTSTPMILFIADLLRQRLG